MTTSNHKKVFKQLKVKQPKLEKYIKHNAPKKRSCGISLKRCKRCGRIKGHVSKYGLDLCRQCFRDIATKIGFKKYN
ncbi:30S ribosomal protein S14 [Candidatus Woesearchaeota archaeon]|nr:30S ribosomal protein S14 [Candidatus Woesearchaeota archaeon]